jgi:teichuronic acid biosynthesis glycosyltransferase TuaG
MNNPLVSVITPMYNAEMFIEETINSVLHQTYACWELLIIDDFSTDQSKSIVKSYCTTDKRIKLLCMKNNFGGPAKARNFGIDNSNGKYIAYLDSDDIWKPNKLDLQVKLLEENLEIDGCHTNSVNIDLDGNMLAKPVPSFLKYICFYLYSKSNCILLTNYININSLVVRSNLGVEFSEDLEVIAIEDLLYEYTLLDKRKTIKYIKDVTVCYRINPSSLSSRRSFSSYNKLLYLYSNLLKTNKISFMMYWQLYIATKMKILLRLLNIYF